MVRRAQRDALRAPRSLASELIGQRLTPLRPTLRFEIDPVIEELAVKMHYLACLFIAPGVYAGNWLDLSLSDDASARTLPSYPHAGSEYVPGQPGREFTVVLSNRSGERLLAVLSVDGVNAVSGETASTQQGGYVLQPYETLRVTGWRKSLQETAKFYFTALPDSYAARTGRPNNVGVIGVAVFREQPTFSQWNPEPHRYSHNSQAGNAQSSRSKESDSLTARPGAASPSAESDVLGTGHGQRQYDPAKQVAFERRSYQPDELVELRYDRYERLLALGIIPESYPYRYQAPQAFPEFVPDPR